MGITHPTSVETADVFGDSAHLPSSLSPNLRSPFVYFKAVCLKLTLMVPSVSQMIIKIKHISKDNRKNNDDVSHYILFDLCS